MAAASMTPSLKKSAAASSSALATSSASLDAAAAAVAAAAALSAAAFSCAARVASSCANACLLSHNLPCVGRVLGRTTKPALSCSRTMNP